MLQDVWELLKREVFPTPSSEEQFNFYTDRNETLDQPKAPALRRENLRAYLECYTEAPPLFLLLEAPGPWGCRFSGVPVTSEAQLTDPDFPIAGHQTSLEDEPHTEYSASIFWRVLQSHFPQFFIWNSVPLHPHDPDEPLSIRTPRRTEVRAWQDLLTRVLRILEPSQVVAVGRKAERALNEIDRAATYVRHPSQGGAKKFEQGMMDILQRTVN